MFSFRKLEMTSNQQESPKVDVEENSEKAETTEDEDRKSSSANDTDKFLESLDVDKDDLLLHAIDNESLTIVEDLLKLDSNPNATNSCGQTALMVAFLNGRLDVVAFLIHYGANLEETFDVAIRKGFADIVEKILAFDLDIIDDVFGQSSINIAIDVDSLEMVKLLLKYDPDVNPELENGSTPIFHAVSKRNIEIIKVLLQNGAKPDVYDDDEMTPLVNAMERNRFDIAKILLEYGADINSSTYDGKTALHHAAKEGKLEIVQFLLKNNANIDCEWGIQYKSTPLYLATESTHAEIVKTLLINGANANHRSAHLAAFVEAKNKMRVYFFEYAKDLNLNIKYEGYTPFEYDLKFKRIPSAKTIVYYLSL